MAHPRQILEQIKAGARKSLSQNFLTSPHWGDLLVHHVLEPKNVDEYWEIGPGLGALTRKLVAKAQKPVRVFEYDKKLSSYLRTEFPNLEIIEGDFLKQDLTQFAGKRIVVLSNLPYHLSSAILFRLVDEKARLVRAVLTFQKEFAERLCASPRTPDYGALSVMAQLHFQIESIGVLPPGAFYPAPAVASEALVLEPKSTPAELVASVSQVVKAAFLHRRKKMASNLKRAFPKAPVDGALSQLGINPNARPEELSKDQFTKLAALISQTALCFLCFLSPALASQDQLYGLGGQSSGRVGSVTASPESPYGALLNPALLPVGTARMSFSTGLAHSTSSTLNHVQVDSPTYRTEHGDNRQEDFTLPAHDATLFSLGLSTPVSVRDRKAGVGITLSGPYGKFRSFRGRTPYDFSPLYYGTSDTQFKVTPGAGIELVKDQLRAGLSMTLYMSSAGSADATLLSPNPTSRMALDMGVNVAPVAGLHFTPSPRTRASLVYRSPLQPRLRQEIDGVIVNEGREVLHQPISLSTTLYYEPATWEADIETNFGRFLVSAGLSFQEWSGYTPSFLTVQMADATTTDVAPIAMRNTLSPRFSVGTNLTSQFLGHLGYRFRPTPVSDLSGPTNLLDADTHIFGASVEYHGALWSDGTPIQVGLYGQYHVAPNRQVTKADASFIGGPGYGFSSVSYTYGVNVGTSL